MFSNDKIKDNAIVTTLAFSPFIACFGMPAWGLWAGWNIGKYKNEKRQLSNVGRYFDPMKIVIGNDILKNCKNGIYDGIPLKKFRSQEMYESCMQVDSPTQLEKNDKVIWKRKTINSKNHSCQYTYHLLNLNGFHCPPYEDEKRLKESDMNLYIKSMIDVENVYSNSKISVYDEKLKQAKQNMDFCLRYNLKDRYKKSKLIYEDLKKVSDNEVEKVKQKWRQYNIPEYTYYILGGKEGIFAVPTCEWENIRIYKKGNINEKEND